MAKSAAQQPDPDYLDEHHQAIVTFADAYLDEDERESFIEHLMERRGYQRRSAWALPEQQSPADPQGGQGDPAGGQGGGRRSSPYFRR